MQSDNKLILGDGRYDANLVNIDPSFYSRGEASLPAKFNQRRYFVQSDDKVLIAGPILLPNSIQTQLWRLNSDGSVDTSFGSVPLSNIAYDVTGFDLHGHVVAKGSSNMDQVYSVTGAVLGTLPSPIEASNPPYQFDTSFYTPNPNGGFVWFATPATSPPQVGHVYRSSGNNGLDTSFGSSGAVTLTQPAIFVYRDTYAVLVKPDNKIVLVIYYGYGGIVMVGLNTDGSPDTEFGPQGYMFVQPYLDFSQIDYSLNNGISGAGQHAEAVFLTADGKILIGGTGGIGGATSSAVIRLAPFTVRSRMYLPALSLK